MIRMPVPFRLIKLEPSEAPTVAQQTDFGAVNVQPGNQRVAASGGSVHASSCFKSEEIRMSEFDRC